MCLLGVLMILTGIFADRESAVLVTLIVLGTGLFVIGISFVRLEGPLELGATGLKTNVQPTTIFDPQAFVATAAAAETVARELLPDTPDKEEKVNAVVGKTLRELTREAKKQGWLIQRTKGHIRFIHPQGSIVTSSARVDRPGLLRRLATALNSRGEEDRQGQSRRSTDEEPKDE
jgi:predicted RNA binding protein YcfA (HicA-like mRNA interferase family)